MTKKMLNRRSVLRGLLAGVATTVALPPLDAMFNGNGTAYADETAIPLRYGVFFWGNGVRPDRWVPRQLGAGWWNDPNEELAPLATSSVRESVSVLSGYKLPQGGTGHWTGRAQMLTGTWDAERGTYGSGTGASSDFIVADAWEGQTPFRSLDVGISRRGKSNSHAPGMTSWDHGGNRVSSEFDPGLLYDRLFGGFDPSSTASVEDARRRAIARRRIVDAVREDANRLRARLGSEDRHRVDAHLEGLRGIERQLEDLGAAAAACRVPSRTADIFSDDFGHELLEEKNDVVADIVAIALACDLSRVFTYQFTSMQSDAVFWQVGCAQGAHVQTHDDRSEVPEGERLPPQFENVHRATVFTMERFTKLLEALHAMPEGDSNVLYNSVVYATSEVADGTDHSTQEWPILIAGRAGGRLRPGMHVRSASEENAVRAPLTCMHAAGVAVDGFGAGASRATRPVSELLA